MAYQSLYRRFRPRRFAEIKGQPHVVAALQGAVREGTVGHAYLLHGPRGTGKTTTARVLAKALNCENRGDDGEPCCTCESCVAIEEGRSFDLHELDAASNNRVENMRELLQRVNLGTPGRAKVYLLDEVHMLTSGAENALLKTLEEPPAHVTWVLATTEPHKVVETIRSRCQVFELRLLGGDAMAEHVRWVIAEAGLDIPADRLDEVVDHVVAEGGGSVRDTLSALDRVVAAGGVVELDTSTDTLLEALVAGDVAGALAGVAAALDRGRDPRTLGTDVLAGLRDAFLTAMGAPPARLPERARRRAETLAAAVPPRVLTRAVEVLGSALVDMRQAPDPRVDLEVALVRLCGVADADSRAGGDADEGTLAALVRRVEALEGRLAALAESPPGRARGGESRRDRPPTAPPPPAVPTRRPAPTKAAPAASPAPSAAAAPAAPAAPRAPSAAAAPAAPAAPRAPSAPAGAAGSSSASVPVAAARPSAGSASAPADFDPARVAAALETALASLPRRVSTWWRQGTVGEVAGGRATITVPVARVAEKCEASRPEVEAALAAAGVGVGLDLVVGLPPEPSPSVPATTGPATPVPSDPPAPAAPDPSSPAASDPAGGEGSDEPFDGHDIDLDELEDAPDPLEEQTTLVTEAFPGSEVIDLGERR